MLVDSNNNRVIVETTSRRCEGLPLAVVRLVDDLSTGYLVLCEEDGGFGDEGCPSSFGRPAMCWFGFGMRFLTADEAVETIAD